MKVRLAFLILPLGSTIIKNLTIDEKVLCNPPLYGLSNLCFTLEPTIFNQLQLIVELGDERCSGGINICIIEIPADSGQGNVNPLLVVLDVIQKGMFGG